MALIVKISINDTVVGYASARRTARGADGGLPGPVEVHRYEVEGVLTDPVATGLVKHSQVNGLSVEHRYGDGAISLAAKTLATVERAMRGEAST